jgi:hypothetical protein
MLDQPKRRRGGQVGNWNRLVHGRRSARVKAARRAEFMAAWKEHELASLAWTATIPPIDYHSICLALELEREQRERDLVADDGPTTPPVRK